MYSAGNVLINTFQNTLGKHLTIKEVTSFASNHKQTKFTFLNVSHTKKKTIGKIGTDITSRELVLNEIKALSNPILKDYAPKIIQQETGEKGILMVTEFIEHSVRKIDKNLSLAITNASIDIAKKTLRKDNLFNLYYCLGHGDLCPWNIRTDINKNIKFIDWEFSDEYPLGYDLFTFFIQSAFLTTSENGLKSIHRNKDYINTYFSEFGINNWKPYLQLYLHTKINSPKIEASLQRKHYRLAKCIVNENFIASE
jgi:hypothetical protein